MTLHHTTSLVHWVQSFSHARVLCLGDIMLDDFVRGTVERMSPEAPVPVLRFQEKTTTLGGVGNVARTLAHLGAQTCLVTVVGHDGKEEVIEMLLNLLPGQNTFHLIKDPTRHTTQKTRYICGSQHLLRVDQEERFLLSNDLEDQIIDIVRQQLPLVEGIIFSDYQKGVLTPRVLTTLISEAREKGKKIIIDPKGRAFETYQGAHVLTPNRHELSEVVGLPTESDAQVIKAAEKLFKRVEVDALLVTRGEKGMSLITQEGFILHASTKAREIFDVSGAGDTVAATFGAAVSLGAPFDQAMHLANTAAGLVVRKVGTATISGEELEEALLTEKTDSFSKIASLNQAQDILARWRVKGYRIGLTNGCFDLLHKGHLSLLEQGKAICDRLIVALNSDKSVSRLKGPQRPFQSEDTRAAILAALQLVDLVVIFNEETPLTLIQTLKPDVLIKGADYTIEKIAGASFVQSYGGDIFLVPLLPGHSTTKTIQRAS